MSKVIQLIPEKSTSNKSLKNKSTLLDGIMDIILASAIFLAIKNT